MTFSLFLQAKATSQSPMSLASKLSLRRMHSAALALPTSSSLNNSNSQLAVCLVTLVVRLEACSGTISKISSLASNSPQLVDVSTRREATRFVH